MIKSFLLSLFILVCSCQDKAVKTPIQTLPEQAATTSKKAPQAIENGAYSPTNETIKIEPLQLLNYVQVAIIPMYKDWVLFENGTYIIFDNIDSIPDIQRAAFQHLKEYTPKTVLESNWDFTISDLDETDGWSVYGNGYGIYTFVHSSELSLDAGPMQIGAYAKAKRALDEQRPKVLFISSKEGIQKIQ